jgi:hypothetical protein
MYVRPGGTGWLASFTDGEGPPQDLAIDRQTGSLFVSGMTQGSARFGSVANNDFIMTAANVGSGPSRYLARYERDGGVTFAYGLSGWTPDGGSALAARGDQVWFAAPFWGSTPPLSGNFPAGQPGLSDIGLVRVAPNNGLIQAAHRFGSRFGNETVSGLAMDDDGGLTMWGFTERAAQWDAGLGWPDTAGTYIITFDTRQPSLPVRWGRFFPGSAVRFTSLAFDSSGRALVGGIIPDAGTVTLSGGTVTGPAMFMGTL